LETANAATAAVDALRKLLRELDAISASKFLNGIARPS
jgi:hypothetical protein